MPIIPVAKRLLGPLTLALLVAACVPSPQPSSPPSTGAGLALPTFAVEPAPGTPPACAGVGLAAILRGDQSDPRLARLERFRGGGVRQDLVWLAGYSARFTPSLEILDQAGRVVLRDGDFVDGACVTSEPDVMWLSPPFLALRLDCGPMAVPDCTSGRINQVASANGWPERQIAEVHFLTADGQYRLVFEDGSEAMGSSSQP